MPSGLYVQTAIGMSRNTIALDWTSISHKIALANSGLTVALATDTTWTSANEVTGTGWTTGGRALSTAAAGGTSTAPTLAQGPGASAVYDMADIAVSGVQVTGIRYLRQYADALADELMWLIDLGGDYGVDGVLRVVWPETTGVVRWTMGS